MKYRRWLPQFDPNLRTTVNIAETYRGHSLQVFVARSGMATTTCAVYIDGRQAAYDIVIGTEPEVLVVGITKAMGLIDKFPGSTVVAAARNESEKKSVAEER